MPTATDTDDAVNPAELLAYALILTKDAGDDDAYARLRGLDPDELGDLLGDDEPDDDDASEVHPEDFAAFADRPDGSQWQTNGRWYKREGGRTFRVSNPQQTQQPAPAGKPAAPEPEPKAEPAPAAKPAKPEAPAKPDPKAVHAEVAAAFAAPHTLTPEKLAGLTEKLKTLGVEQLKALQADRAAGGKVKADRVAKLVAWAKAQTAPKPPEKPAPHAAARAALDAHGIAHGHLTDAEVSDRLRAAFAPKPAVAPAKPAAAKKPTPAPKPAAKKPAAPAGPPRTDAGKAVAAIYDRAASASDADVEAAKAHLAKMPADEVARTAAAMGMVGKATKAAVLARITDRRGTAVRGRLLDRPAGPLSGEHIDRTEKELNDTAALDRSDPAGSPARADAAVARLKATHTADEIRELSRRLTGKAGRTPDESLARIHGELTPVSRLLDSQKV